MFWTYGIDIITSSHTRLTCAKLYDNVNSLRFQEYLITWDLFVTFWFSFEVLKHFLSVRYGIKGKLWIIHYFSSVVPSFIKPNWIKFDYIICQHFRGIKVVFGFICLIQAEIITKFSVAPNFV